MPKDERLAAPTDKNLHRPLAALTGVGRNDGPALFVAVNVRDRATEGDEFRISSGCGRAGGFALCEQLIALERIGMLEFGRERHAFALTLASLAQRRAFATCAAVVRRYATRRALATHPPRIS